MLPIIAAALWVSIGFYFGSQYRNIFDAIKELKEKEEPKVAEIATSSPHKPVRQPDEDGSFVVSTKSPRQLEKEAKEEVDRIGGLL